MENKNTNNIRNFVIIAHINHGKSTLADRFLELTKTIPEGKMKPQYLDLMDLERERGITIKMQPCRMNYNINGNDYVLNLIDTPGHADFSYEVSRSLAAVEGAILLVDAVKGVQAQTLANLELAKKQGLAIIPAINKIDLNYADAKIAAKEIAGILKIDESEVLNISAKYGQGVKELLSLTVDKIPSPKIVVENCLKALIFDSKYDAFKGVVAYVRIMGGGIKKGEKIYLVQAKTQAEAKEIGFFTPDFLPCRELGPGEIGYIATGIKEPGKVRVGETITKIPDFQSSDFKPLPGYQTVKPMVFASIYPENTDNFDVLKVSLNKLKLNDPALDFEQEKGLLGRGFRCGFLGSLHVEIVLERLFREFDLNLIVSSPSALYKIIDKRGDELLIFTASDWPLEGEIKEVLEPFASLKIITPLNFMSSVFDILKKRQAKYIETEQISEERFLLVYEIPLREIINGLYDDLKTATQGFASLDYEVLGYLPSDLIKIEILIAGKKEESFSKIVPRKNSFEEAKRTVSKLKSLLPQQLFSVSLQAAVSGKIIVRENISAKRRDVIAPLYGGDYTRKRKLLEKQKRGKQKLKERGQITIPQKVFLEMLKR